MAFKTAFFVFNKSAAILTTTQYPRICTNKNGQITINARLNAQAEACGFTGFGERPQRKHPADVLEIGLLARRDLIKPIGGEMVEAIRDIFI
jgi:hypothetical protein